MIYYYWSITNYDLLYKNMLLTIVIVQVLYIIKEIYNIQYTMM